MTALLVFSVTLLAMVLLSEIAHRTVLSAAVVFLIVGLVFGPGVLNLVRIQAGSPVVERMAELALFAVLFTDGMHVNLSRLHEQRPAGPALLIGLPLTLLGNASLAHWLIPLPWGESFLLGAVLTPTDPVFAAAIVEREEIPVRVRRLLNVESGLNDGLVLPIVVLLAAFIGQEPVNAGKLVADLALGVLIGIVIPWLAITIERASFLSAKGRYAPLYAFAIGLIVLSLSEVTHANPFLAAFTAGAQIGSTNEEIRHAFERFGDLLARLFKLAAVFIFGALVTPKLLGSISWQGYLFAAATLLLVRPAALGIALARSRLNFREWGTVAWFGPKGFASVLYGIYVLHSDVHNKEQLFNLAALVTAASIIAHSSTDVLVARLFEKIEPERRQERLSRLPH